MIDLGLDCDLQALQQRLDRKAAELPLYFSQNNLIRVSYLTKQHFQDGKRF
jgi:hypothetical protein